MVSYRNEFFALRVRATSRAAGAPVHLERFDPAPLSADRPSDGRAPDLSFCDEMHLLGDDRKPDGVE